MNAVDVVHVYVRKGSRYPHGVHRHGELCVVNYTLTSLSYILPAVFSFISKKKHSGDKF